VEISLMMDSRRPYPVTGYQLEVLDDELIIFHPAGMKVLHSNQSGTLIWQLCDGQRTVDDIVALLRAAYPEADAEIETSVQETLQIFAEHGAIQWE
jgi:hypothetical protein